MHGRSTRCHQVAHFIFIFYFFIPKKKYALFMRSWLVKRSNKIDILVHNMANHCLLACLFACLFACLPAYPPCRATPIPSTHTGTVVSSQSPLPLPLVWYQPAPGHATYKTRHTPTTVAQESTRPGTAHSYWEVHDAKYLPAPSAPRQYQSTQPIHLRMLVPLL